MGNVCASNTADGTSEPVDSQPSVQSEKPKEEAQEDVVVTIVGARGVRDSDWLPGAGKPDCYVEVKSKGKLLFTTKVIPNSCEPVWMEEKELEEELEEGAALEFFVYDKDLIGSDFLGKAALEPSEFSSGGFNKELELKEAKKQGAYLKVKVKVPGKDLPEGLAPEYTVTVEKANDKDSFGLRLDKQDPKRLFVMGLMSGPFDRYNKEKGPEEQVKVNDFLVAVNSATDSASMLQEFGSTKKATCKFKRGVPVSVVFDRGDGSEPLGLKFPVKPGAMTTVLIQSVEGGAAAKHNENAKAHEKFEPGDRLLAVGSAEGKAEQIMKAIEKAKGQVQLIILKPAQSDSWSHWLFG